MARGIAVQQDNKILVAGSLHVGDDFGGHNQFALLRYLSNGIPDTTFSFDGLVTTSNNF